MASSMEASLGGKGLQHSNPFHDHLGQLLDIDVAAWWRPSAGGYFARVRKAGMQRALDAIGGPVLAAKYASSKVAEMADACEKLCDGSAITEPEIREAGIAWLPAAMRFDPNQVEETGADGEDAPHDEESEGGAAGEKNNHPAGEDAESGSEGEEDSNSDAATTSQNA